VYRIWYCLYPGTNDHCRTARSIHRRRPPRQRASIRPRIAHVTRVYFKCFRCFIWILQVFHLYVIKVDWNVAYVAVDIHVFQVYFPNVSSRFPYVCLQVFYLDVSYVFTYMKCFQVFFCKCFHIHVSSVSVVSYVCCKCFIWMF
jgi:hypothetical protein